MPARQSPLTNVYVCAFAAYACFSTSDAFTKALHGPLSVFEIGFFENAFASLVLMATRHQNERWIEFWKMSRPWPIHFRAICGVVSSLCAIYAFTTIPLVDAYSLIFLAPFFVTVMSVLILKEQVGLWRWFAVLLGFVGVLLAVKPGFQAFQLGHFGAMVAGLSTGTSIIIMRGLGSAAKKTSILGMLFIYLVLINGIGMVLHGFTAPALHDLVLMALSGLCVGLGQWAFVSAARYGNATQIAPVAYSQLGWAMLFGIIIFQEYPDLLAVVGVGIIASAGLLTVLRERIRRIKPANPPGIR
ncbi:DMT family transporter [Mesorhizobium sp. M2A.F.Ca.ET.037.01.1.1]|uniref:DMT family transporter n=1 Tax=unclassified Mesorhizobium TaxID=325217 RepID=UPI000F7576D4|nr:MULTISPECIES: DMT family transporter [unclassified Mesorhizobium]AZO16126.1 DMT family transporter [Mesorhizobium sp. M2A.F.Ca.ET.043.05.1.1]RUX21158.1 DMT family transporter [Mesorhizobium sp. M2A.F.Ca.ET.037.01.1.1]RWA79073.1 MAG: DMT family transporter [Mesorhizobium sp.]RWE75913.1 MAG: DMT family transporter [Mesorhizobium sp.]TIV17002.1 MAG: DMT family transporter [Mesorhizobium sp.]